MLQEKIYVNVSLIIMYLLYLFVAADLQQKSWNAELAVIELINKFLGSVPSKQIQDLKDNWSVTYYNVKR